MTTCEVCGMDSHHDRPRCIHCSDLDQSFSRLLVRNPTAAERWATAKQIEASVKVRLQGETLANG